MPGDSWLRRLLATRGHGRSCWLYRGAVCRWPSRWPGRWIPIVAFLAYPIPIAFLSEGLLRTAALAGAGLLLVAILALALSPHLQKVAGTLRPQPGTVGITILLLMIFFAIYAVIFVSLGSVVVGSPVPQLATVAIISWIVGYIPLGTPGGLGTREAMVLLLAGPLIGPVDALLLAGLFRLVTILGDAVCAGIGLLIAPVPVGVDPAQ
jgi:glycosyltransferase 2 family protein